MSDPRRQQVLELLRRHGAGSTSFQTLERGLDYWFDPGEDAAVAYLQVGGRRVVAGTPIAPADAQARVATAFAATARRGAVFFGAEPPFLAALADAGVPHAALQIAEQPEWDPRAWSLDGPRRRTLRAQVRRAARKGVRVRRVSPEELARAPGSLRVEIDAVLDRWLAARPMSVMRFMVDLEPFTFPEERRYYIAEQGDRPVGFLAAVPVYGRQGWFFEDVIRVPDAPNGTAELLLHAAFSDARDAGDAYVTLGMAPLAGVRRGPGPHRGLRAALATCRERLGFLYGFHGVESFKRRFVPDGWAPIYLVACPGPVGVGSLRAVLTAFAGGGLVRFGLGTAARLLARVPMVLWALALALLAGLLVPWTVLLALVDGHHWFGDVSIQWAWVIFDAGLALALFLLTRLVILRRPAARSFALFLAGTTFTDFMLSSVQAFHLHRDVVGWPLLLVLIGIAGPGLATTLLLAIARFAPVRPREDRP